MGPIAWQKRGSTRTSVRARDHQKRNTAKYGRDRQHNMSIQKKNIIRIIEQGSRGAEEPVKVSVCAQARSVMTQVPTQSRCFAGKSSRALCLPTSESLLPAAKHPLRPSRASPCRRRRSVKVAGRAADVRASLVHGGGTPDYATLTVRDAGVAVSLFRSHADGYYVGAKAAERGPVLGSTG